VTDRILLRLLQAAAALAVAIVLLIAVFVFREAIPALRGVGVWMCIVPLSS